MQIGVLKQGRKFTPITVDASEQALYFIGEHPIGYEVFDTNYDGVKIIAYDQDTIDCLDEVGETIKPNILGIKGNVIFVGGININTCTVTAGLTDDQISQVRLGVIKWRMDVIRGVDKGEV